MVSNSVGSAPGCRSIVELLNTISGGKFLEHVGDAGCVMYIIVHIAMTYCLKRRAKFLPPIFAGGKSNVGEEHKSKLSVVNGDAIGGHAPCF